MKTLPVFCTLVMASALSTASCTVCNSKKAAGGSRSARAALFHGKTLERWTVLNCEATVDNEDILIVAGDIWGHHTQVKTEISKVSPEFRLLGILGHITTASVRAYV